MYLRQTSARLAQLARQFPAVLILGGRQVAESLAGRVGILELSPLTVQEAGTGDAPAPDYRTLWLCAGFPDAPSVTHRGFDKSVTWLPGQ